MGLRVAMQIAHMVAFIEKEGLEKAEEIDTKVIFRVLGLSVLECTNRGNVPVWRTLWGGSWAAGAIGSPRLCGSWSAALWPHLHTELPSRHN